MGILKGQIADILVGILKGQIADILVGILKGQSADILVGKDLTKMMLSHLVKSVGQMYWLKANWSNVLAESQLVTSLYLTWLPSPQLMVTLLVLMFWPTDVNFMS